MEITDPRVDVQPAGGRGKHAQIIAFVMQIGEMDEPMSRSLPGQPDALDLEPSCSFKTAIARGRNPGDISPPKRALRSTADSAARPHFGKCASIQFSPTP